MSEADILRELQKISKIITISNGAALEKELAKYATNDDRKKIWVLINNEMQPDDIVKISGLKKSAVYGFLKTLEISGLIEKEYGKPPKKILDYVPSNWINLVQNITTQDESGEQQTVLGQQAEVQKNGVEKIP